MTMKTIPLLAIALFSGIGLAIAAPQARAQANPELTQFLVDQIGSVVTATENACEAQQAGSDAQADDSEIWQLHNFWLRIKPQFGFDVSGLTKFQIVPEIEILVTRPFPDGYKAFKP
jgi:hypothetical protein